MTLLRYLRGGDDVTGATLTRFFGFHVALLPALFTAVPGRPPPARAATGDERAPRIDGPARKAMPFYPGFILRDAILWLGVLAVLLVLCTFLPWELGSKADPFAPAPAGIRPEWYFTFLSQSLKYVPGNRPRHRG